MLFGFYIIIAVKYGGYPSDLESQFWFLTCFVSLRKLVDVSDESMAHVTEEEYNSYHGELLQETASGTFSALSKCLIKSSFFPLL